ncbi:MAG TPA: hypothetical protein VEY30_14240, partial [Myxococcaceae bacterium]|nr:hypothetical protein [Myxococcaceae bacterium]
TDPAESDLTRVGLDALERHFGQDSVTVASGSASDRRAPFWTWLILLATLAFIGEGALLRR